MKKLNWQKIYSEHSPILLGICRRYIPDIYAAEDILQDSFITAIQKEHQLKDEKVLFAWLKKIVINNALQYLRKSSREHFIHPETSEISEIPLATSENMEEKNLVLTYDFTCEELLSSIDRLPSHHKSVFNLYCLENHSHAEIAGMLGISVNTSKSHLLRAKKTLQNYLVNHVLKPDTPKNKKKMTQLLIFLGFGSLLWAQTIRTRFSNFSIEPSKSFEIPESIQTKNINFQSSSGVSLKTKIIAAAGLLVIILGSVMFFCPNNNIPDTSNIKEQNNETVNEKEEIKTEVSSKSITNISTESAVNKEITKINTAEKDNAPEKVTGKMTQTKPKISGRDSAESIPKKIIVVKKIIQRDTIYVER
ncbi:RNA polymerase sigma factor [Chryseobacterium sp. OSA05B]|uniref:RNA polymerase sigma factor n=1 Tax=Chryseobacterium sp. OSA05B TaxID=2862650 RepID=UPI001CBFDD96|nr:sigma-70 family RNA polymerase sigma factor [Chryseobacterium sp. OSA05B]